MLRGKRVTWPKSHSSANSSSSSATRRSKRPSTSWSFPSLFRIALDRFHWCPGGTHENSRGQASQPSAAPGQQPLKIFASRRDAGRIVQTHIRYLGSCSILCASAEWRRSIPGGCLSGAPPGRRLLWVAYPGAALREGSLAPGYDPSSLLDNRG